MTKPLSTTMWCPAVKVGTRWQLVVHAMSHSKASCAQAYESTLHALGGAAYPIKYVKVRIQEVQGAGFLVSKGGKK